MEQLTAPAGLGRLMEVQMLMRKVRIELSRDQFNALMDMIQLYMTRCSLVELEDKSVFFQILKLYDHRLRTKQLQQTPMVKFSVDITVAHAMLVLLDFLYCIEMGVYEMTLLHDLYRQIDQQTA